jgi:hypothetical protein
VLDVNRDGHTAPIDALIVINGLNAAVVREDGESPPLLMGGSSGQVWYPDVNGDRVVTPLDALLVINHLNAAAAIGGEGETAGGEGQWEDPVATADQYVPQTESGVFVEFEETSWTDAHRPTHTLDDQRYDEIEAGDDEAMASLVELLTRIQVGEIDGERIALREIERCLESFDSDLLEEELLELLALPLRSRLV